MTDTEILDWAEEKGLNVYGPTWNTSTRWAATLGPWCGHSKTLRGPIVGLKDTPDNQKEPPCQPSETA